ncbi:MAG: type II toxin-antitoxin system VapC family toxin [Gammaproteobacteria bacterium]|nr:type II toxin-antitoxin system VapC family toxin [Gammaproteobacteria bacterium]
MAANESQVIYWDASAVLSVLFDDKHSPEAQHWAMKDVVHLISTLAYVETYAVIARIEREGVLARVLIEAVTEGLEQGPWRRLHLSPDWNFVQPLSVKWRLRGADLWHLATAKRIQSQLPELCLLTFDARLEKAAQGEDMAIG